MSAKKEEIIIEVRANYTDALVAIGKYQQETEKLKLAQAIYNEGLRDGTLKKEEYRKKINETNAAIKFNAEQVRMLNKEVQSNLKYEQAAAGSMNEMKARLSSLTAEYNALGDSVAGVARKNSIGNNISEITKKLSDEEQALGNFHRQVGNYEVATESIRSELKKLTEEITRMKLAGKESSDEYIALVKRASEVKDAFGDAAREINVGASDTKGLDVMTQSITTLTASFTALNSADGLFGDEQERVNGIIEKAQLLMGALAAATALQNTFQKESAILQAVTTVQSKAKVAAELLSTKSTLAATVAQRVLNAVAMANPYVLLAAALLTVVGGLVLFSKGAETAADKQEKLNARTKAYLDYLDYTNKRIEEVADAKISAAESDLELAKAQKKSTAEIEALEDAVFAAKMAKHGAMRKENRETVDNLVKNQSELDRLQQELNRLQQEKINGNDKYKQFVEIDGKKMYLDFEAALGVVQAEIEKKQHSVTLGLKITNEEANDVDAEKMKDAEKAAVANEKYAEAVKERKQKEKEAIMLAQDSIIALMKEGAAKEVAAVSVKYEREIADLQTRIDTEKNLTPKAKEELMATIINLKNQEFNELEAIGKAFDEREFQRQVEAKQMEIENRLRYTEEGSSEEQQIKMEALELAMQQELEANRAKGEALMVDEGLVRDKYNALKLEQIDEFNRQAMQKEFERVQLASENEIMQLELDGQNTLQRKLELKRQEIDALAQMDEESDAEFLNRKLTLQTEEKQIIADVSQTKQDETNNMLTSVGGAFGAMSNLMGNMAEDNEALATFSKVLAMFEIGVNTAIAISGAVKAASNSKTVWEMIAAIAVGVTAVVAAVMQATSMLNKQKQPKKPKLNKYATGGLIVGEGSGTSDSILARVSNGESIMTQVATQMFSPILSSFNQMGGGVPIQVANTSAQVRGEEMLARAFAKGAASLPRPVVSVEEIRDVSSRLDVIEGLRNM